MPQLKTLAVFGAGPVTGRSIARRFGREGFRVALVARRAATLDPLVAELTAEGVDAAGFLADAYDPAQLAGAMAAIADRYGQLDVVEFSPGGGTLDVGIVSTLDIDVPSMRLLLDRFLLAPIALIRLVLPGMLDRGDGALLFTGGQSGIHPTAVLGSAGVVQAGLRNYVYTLHSELAPKGVYAGLVNIGALIEGSVPHRAFQGREHPVGFEPEVISPDALADHFWALYTNRDRAEVLAGTFGR